MVICLIVLLCLVGMGFMICVCLFYTCELGWFDLSVCLYFGRLLLVVL